MSPVAIEELIVSIEHVVTLDDRMKFRVVKGRNTGVGGKRSLESVYLFADRQGPED